MAYIYTEVEVDIDVDDFVNSCSFAERKELFNKLRNDVAVWKASIENLSLMELEWNEALTKLSNARLQLTNEEEEIIKKIANKY